MSKPMWGHKADRLHRAIVWHSNEKRSPERQISVYSGRDAERLALALSGEVGEVAQLIYKRERDGLTTEEFRAAGRKELADVRIYLELLATCFGVDDLDQDVKDKLEEVLERWRKKGLDV